MLGMTYSSVSPSRVKKLFTGNGRATKRDMYVEFQHILNIDHYEIFGIKDNKKAVTAVPIQDIVDAFALVGPYFCC